MWMAFFVRTSHSKRASIMASKFFMLIAKRLAQDRRQSFLLLRTWLGWKLVWNSEKNKRCWLGRNISLWSEKLGWWRRIKKCNSFICLHSKKLFTRSKEWSLAPRKLVQFWKTQNSQNGSFWVNFHLNWSKFVMCDITCIPAPPNREFHTWKTLQFTTYFTMHHSI